MPLPVPALPLTPALAQRVSGRPFLLLLDIDGTLSPIAPRPESALVSPEIRRVLAELAGQTDVHVAVISGRAATDAARLVAVSGTWTIGNHGIEVAAPGQSPIANAGAQRFAGAIAVAAERCGELVRGIPGGGAFVEDKRWTLSVHYRLAPRSVVPDLIERVSAVARDLGLRVMQGKELIEVRPPIAVDKGTAAVDLADGLGAFGADAALLYAGDDRTDEDAFRALRTRQPQSVTVRVGDELVTSETAAEFYVPDTESMRVVLESIAELRRKPAVRVRT